MLDRDPLPNVIPTISEPQNFEVREDWWSGHTLSVLLDSLCVVLGLEELVAGSLAGLGVNRRRACGSAVRRGRRCSIVAILFGCGAIRLGQGRSGGLAVHIHRSGRGALRLITHLAGQG